MQRLKAEAEGEVHKIVREFEEIKATILLSTLEAVIGGELKRLKYFIHKHPGLLTVPAISKFYETFIASSGFHPS